MIDAPSPLLSEAQAWSALLALRSGRDPGGALRRGPGGRWVAAAAPSPDARRLLALFLPILGAGDRPLVVAHLAQSLDGRIATDSGASQWITGPEDITHCHRLRAACDAVLVGAETAVLDNPRLTVRTVEGPDPLRVVLDPRRRLRADCALCDGSSPTAVLSAGAGPDRLGRARVLRLPERDGAIAPRDIIEALAGLGVRRLYIEGGGLTVSSFLRAGCVDRLHLCVAPMLLGSGRPAISLPGLRSLSEAMRPETACYRLGADMLFDCAITP